MSWQAKGWDELMDSLEVNECITWDGFEDALIGITTGIEPVAVYDLNKMIRVCTDRDEMSHDDAMEHIQFNTLGGYLGPKTPMAIRLDWQRACAIVKPPTEG